MLKSYHLIHHFRELWMALKNKNVEGYIRISDFGLAILMEQKGMQFQPQFLAKINDQKYYIPKPDKTMETFSGWRENSYIQWDASNEKIAFKKYMSDCNLPTPKFCLDNTESLGNVIVKTSRSSFSKGIRGPYKNSSDTMIDPSKGEFFEQFIPGRIVKLWYWNTIPVAAELLEMLGVFGNDHSTIFELLENHRLMLGENPKDYDLIKPFLSYQNLSLESVPKKGEEIKVDFRYASIFPLSYRARDIRLGEENFFGLEDFLGQAGEKFWHAIPLDKRHNLVYSVDAILDDHNQLWFLEMNSNPYVHPYVYPHMLQA